MKIIVILILVVSVSVTHAQWQKVLEVGDSTIYDINFLTSDEVSTNGIVSIFGLGATTTSAVTFRTADGGNSWLRQTVPNIFYNTTVTSSAIKDSKTLWLGTGNILVNELSKSDDFGLTYYTIPIKEDPNGLAYSRHSKILMLAGDQGLYTSSDEGQNWDTIVPYTLSDDWYSGFAFVNDSVGMVSSGRGIGFRQPKLFTFDGGKTWDNPIDVDEAWQPLGIRNTSTYMLASERTQNIIRSDDFGKTWDTTYNFEPLSITGCIVGDFCHLFVQSDGNGVYCSTDGGYSWVKISDKMNGYQSRFFYHNNTLFVADKARVSNGMNATLWKYTLPPNKPTMIVDDITITAPPCSSTDTTGIFLPIAAVNQCDGDKVILDTMFVTGSTDFIITRDSLNKEIVWDTLRVRYEPTDANEDTAFVHFRFKLKGNYFDTVMTIRGKGTQPQDSISFLATLTKPSVTWEEITELRVLTNKMAVNKNLSEIRFDITLDADVLEPLTNYSTGIAGASIKMGSATSVGKLSRYPFVITGTNMTLDSAINILNLPMRPYVSDTTMTTIELSTIHFNPQDPDYERCTLSATGSGVPFQLNLMCGDSLLSQYLGGKPILVLTSLTPNPANGVIAIDFNSSIKGEATLQIIDDIGGLSFEEKLVVKLNRNTHEVLLSSLPNGTFFIRLQIGKDVVTGKFVKQ